MGQNPFGRYHEQTQKRADPQKFRKEPLADMKHSILFCLYALLILCGNQNLTKGQNPRQMAMCPFTNFFCPCMESCPQNGYAMGYCFMRFAIKCCPVWVVNLCARSRTMVDP